MEHGSGDNCGAAVVGAVFLRFRTVRRWTKTMSKLKSSKRHMEGRVALRAMLCVNCWLDAASVAGARRGRGLICGLGRDSACPTLRLRKPPIKRTLYVRGSYHSPRGIC